MANKEFKFEAVLQTNLKRINEKVFKNTNFMFDMDHHIYTYEIKFYASRAVTHRHGIYISRHLLRRELPDSDKFWLIVSIIYPFLSAPSLFFSSSHDLCFSNPFLFPLFPKRGLCVCTWECDGEVFDPLIKSLNTKTVLHNPWTVRTVLRLLFEKESKKPPQKQRRENKDG